MNKKIFFAIWIIFLAIVGVIISWKLANKFTDIADFKYIEIIITTAVFLAGFGLIALDKKDSVFFVNFKQIVSWSMLSIVSAFCYIIFQSSQIWSKMFFGLSAGFLFFTITLVFILVLYHNNNYLKEIEKQKAQTSC
jgi:hypothetical protein